MPTTLPRAVGAVALLFLAPRLSVVAAAAASLVYGATLFASSLFSFLYHVLERAKRRSLFRLLDHGAIFLLIAGTYTPLTVVAARGSWSFVVLVRNDSIDRWRSNTVTGLSSFSG